MPANSQRKFIVVEESKYIPSESSIDFYLRRDAWNDFSFTTLYQLYKPSKTGADLIGDVKILKKGQTKKDYLQLKVGTFLHLDETFCSVGQSLDYYERISLLEEDERSFILKGLRDVIDNPKLVDEFKNEEGWQTSLFRDVEGMHENDTYNLSKVLLTGNYNNLPTDDMVFHFKIPECIDPIKFSFEKKDESLPSRIIILIGQNGTGKSTILSRLARVAHGSRMDREQEILKNLGELTPPGLGFLRIISISFSAFDSFQVPGNSTHDQKKIIEEMETGEGRYYNCGLRDIASELKDSLRESEVESVIPQKTKDRNQNTTLKSLDKIANEYIANIRKILAKRRFQMYENSLIPILKDPSFSNIDEKFFKILATKDHELKNHFLSLSTGHKIIIHIMSSICAHLQPRSLVLIDEPESHLHPPLLSALMHGIRIALQDQQSYAVVATHSPVILQETLAHHVIVVNREGGSIKTNTPRIQTFGENIGMITSEVFDLNSEVSDYHSILKTLTTKYQNFNDVNELFDEGMSMQARAYVMALLASKDVK